MSLPLSYFGPPVLGLERDVARCGGRLVRSKPSSYLSDCRISFPFLPFHNKRTQPAAESDRDTDVSVGDLDLLYGSCHLLGPDTSLDTQTGPLAQLPQLDVDIERGDQRDGGVTCGSQLRV